MLVPILSQIGSDQGMSLSSRVSILLSLYISSGKPESLSTVSPTDVSMKYELITKELVVDLETEIHSKTKTKTHNMPCVSPKHLDVKIF